jgi:hypothetical protein
MEQNLKEGSYYVLADYYDQDKKPYILNRIVSIEVKYTKQGEFFLHKKFRNEDFAEYIRIDEPMLFDHRGIECFANIPAFSTLNDYNNCYLLNNHQNGKRMGDGYQVDTNFNLYQIASPNCFLENRVYPYPIGGGHSLHLRLIEGTELMELIEKIKDHGSFDKGAKPTFNNHKRKLETLFVIACQVGGFPYKTVAEYHTFMARKNSIEQQQEINTQRKNQQDGEAARRILGDYNRYHS